MVMIRTALITGAANRLGRAMALDLAAAGWDIALHFHSSATAAAATAGEVEGLGRRVALLQADLSDESAVVPLVGLAAAALSPPLLLVNNAARFERDEALTSTRHDWDQHLAVNLRAPFVLAQAFARQLHWAQNPAAEGLIVNLLDQRVWNLTPHFTSYTVSKYALWGLTQSLALALAPRIRVNGIGPGLTLPSPQQSLEQMQARQAQFPLERGGSVGEVLAALRYLLAARSVTGQMIAVDGGQHLAWQGFSAPATAPKSMPDQTRVSFYEAGNAAKNSRD
ncbi:MAG: SDR family oxidoreductase [Alphaproteobacteria bacterium]|nr:SDR family oxidoreductase [Alphaproteobacteria bacterium]